VSRKFNFSLGPTSLSDKFNTLSSLGVRVEREENSSVLEGVLLLGEGTLGNGSTGGTNDGLDFIRVDDSGDVGVADLGDGKVVIPLEGGTLLVSTEYLIQQSESTFSPDNESSQMSTRSQLK
jgi:hypothetical protein